MKRITFFTACIFFLLCTPLLAEDHLRLATTTSTDNSGLLAELLPPFEKANHCQVDVIAVGTGKAIKLGENGDVDVILVHARSREDEFVAKGFGIDRRDVMYNDFVILGPDNDPAEIKNIKDVGQAMKMIATSGAPFVSRGDDSGTHTREKQLWKTAGITPAGGWYLEAGRGMGDVIIMASERLGYTLSDRGTYLAFKEKTPLQIMVAGDARMFNPYGAIMVNPQRHPHVKVDLSRRFLDYLTSAEARTLINGFRKGGEQLFYTAE
ncbi:MAG: substrate-binding domain-containing protein [Deltaproteobacteria bacterium]|jgi:tungstate transport system substrate-binding protein|nr:substrate-binding domain-containing protein [Deltaproteobacteria bacterium]MCW9050468.1 substrate-binding domain-containing protein [Deltaproteobacteria bacterium]